MLTLRLGQAEPTEVFLYFQASEHGVSFSSSTLLYQYLQVSFFWYLKIQLKCRLLSEIFTDTSFPLGRINFSPLCS